MVYFLWDRINMMLKVGGTHQKLRYRLKQQGFFDDDQVALVGIMEGDKRAEKAIQDWIGLFADRYRQSDWFFPNDQLVKFVNRHVCSPIIYDFNDTASDDETPQACVLLYELITVARVQWLKKLGKHVGKKWNVVQQEALRAYALQRGFNETLPEIPEFKRRNPLLKQDKNGEWWVLNHGTGQYVSGGNENNRPEAWKFRREYRLYNSKPTLVEAWTYEEEEDDNSEAAS